MASWQQHHAIRGFEAGISNASKATERGGWDIRSDLKQFYLRGYDAGQAIRVLAASPEPALETIEDLEKETSEAKGSDGFTIDPSNPRHTRLRNYLLEVRDQYGSKMEKLSVMEDGSVRPCFTGYSALFRALTPMISGEVEVSQHYLDLALSAGIEVTS